MPIESAYLMAKRVEADVNRLLAATDILSMEAAVRTITKLLKRDAADARLDVRDYEFAETRVEQQRLGKAANARLEAVRKGILAASQYNIIGAVDVATLSSHIDYLLERLD